MARRPAATDALDARLRREGEAAFGAMAARPLPALDFTRLAALEDLASGATEGWRARAAAWWRGVAAGGSSAWRSGLVGSLAIGAMLAAVALATFRPVAEWRGAPGASEGLRSGASVRTLAAREGLLRLGPATVFVAGDSELTVEGDHRLRLDAGEAWFEVAATDAPFVVATPAGEIAVVGTRFGVRMDAAGRLRVALEEGEVQLVTPSLVKALRPGEAVVLEPGSNELRFDLEGAEEPRWLRPARTLALAS